MLEKLKNILIKYFENPYDDAIFSFVLGLIFLILGTTLGNIFLKPILLAAAVGSGASFIAVSYVHGHKIREEKMRKKNETLRAKMDSSQEKNQELRGLRGNNIIKINSINEIKHTSLDDYINNINFIEYLIVTIGYPGYEEDIKRLDFYKVLATPNTGQETLDELDLSLNDLKNEVCDKIDSYFDYINREPKSPRRRYRK